MLRTAKGSQPGSRRLQVSARQRGKVRELYSTVRASAGKEGVQWNKKWENALVPVEAAVVSAGLAPNSDGVAAAPAAGAAPKSGFGASAGLLAAGAAPKSDGAEVAGAAGAAALSAGLAPNKFREGAV